MFTGVDIRKKIFEQLAPSKFHWPEKYRSASWTDMKGGICPPPPPPKKLKIEQYEPPLKPWVNSFSPEG